MSAQKHGSGCRYWIHEWRIVFIRGRRRRAPKLTGFQACAQMLISSYPSSSLGTHLSAKLRFGRGAREQPRAAKLELRPQAHVQAGAWARGQPRILIDHQLPDVPSAVSLAPKKTR